MKKSVKWILMALVSIGIFVCVFVAYNNLKEEYNPNSFSEVSETATEHAADSESVAAPDFTVYDENGNAVKLSDFFGKPTVINFWASWCYYCKQEMPDFEKAYKEHGDITFMMVNVTDGTQETVEAAKSYIEKEGFSFPIYFDTSLEAANTYGAYGLPMTFFIDADGNVVTYASGMLTADNLEKAIEMIK